MLQPRCWLSYKLLNQSKRSAKYFVKPLNKALAVSTIVITYDVKKFFILVLHTSIISFSYICTHIWK